MDEEEFLKAAEEAGFGVEHFGVFIYDENIMLSVTPQLRRFADIVLSRRPLTEKQILSALDSFTHPFPARLPPGWLRFARTIERAHGIGVEDGAA